MSQTARTATGIANNKLLMWFFLASDCLFFGTLISTHLIYRKLYPSGALEKGSVDIQGMFDLKLTSFSTFILLMSSFLMALAVSAAHKGHIRSFRRTCTGVILFGLIFLGCQVYEFQHFYQGQAWYDYKTTSNTLSGTFHDIADPTKAKKHLLAKLPKGTEITNFVSKKTIPSLTLQSSSFGTTFFVLTGTHGMHVAIGVLWLVSLLVYSYSGRMKTESGTDVEIAGLYWHFVDIVWIIIFTVVYLIEYL